jgi:CheY-like chemotaxis protein/anti-sigma regulatory factor (Ser/Thr protein kinase)
MKRILVIEDEPALRDSILDILDAENFYAVGAKDGKEGVQAAYEFQPNLILCDVMMPELDGYGVLHHLRENPKTATIPFLFLTAKADKADVRQGMELGADDYLTKPFTHDELLQAIATRLGKQAVVEQQTQEKLDALRHNISLALPHELNTALNVISGMASILVEDYDTIAPAELLEVAKSIQKASNRLRRLVYNALLMVKLDVLAANPDQLHTLRADRLDDTETVITEVALQKAAQYHREADLTLELASVPACISEWKLKKLVEELLDNAFKFSHLGSVVKVVSSCHDGQFILHVIDHGRGMTEEQIANIGAYMQFDRATQEQQGVGLGLAIVKRLANICNGEVILEGVVGKQTIVRVALPSPNRDRVIM